MDKDVYPNEQDNYQEDNEEHEYHKTNNRHVILKSPQDYINDTPQEYDMDPIEE